MKILELRLIAFGPFDGRVLNFEDRPDAVQIVYGGNEAGKSTSLRALEGLLFGIDASTPDAFKHATGSLRVGGKLQGGSGEILEIVRRKGRKDTLRDGTDRPMDEGPLRRMLQGVDRDLFRAIWGLDHVRLREGARAIFAGKGGLGESLFEAGLAGAGAAKLAVTLKEEADAIWAPRATTRPLAEALKKLGESRQASRRDATSVEAYRLQVEGIDRANDTRDEADAEQRTIDTERRRLERALRVIDPLRERRGLLAERTAMGDVRILPEGEDAERVRAEEDGKRAREVLAELEARRREVELRLAALGEDEIAVDPGEAIAALSTGLGQVRAHHDKKGRLELERSALELALRETTSERLTEADERRIVSAMRARAQARTIADAAREAALVARAEVEAAEAASKEAPAPSEDVGAIERALGRADRALDPEELRANVSRARLSRAKAEAMFLSLGLFDGDLDALGAVRAPAIEEVDQAARALDKLGRSTEAEEAEAARLDARRAALDLDRAMLVAAGEPPSQAELDRARQERDDVILRALDPGNVRESGSPPNVGAARDAARALIERADAIADRMRTEVDRATRLSVIAVEAADVGVRLGAAQRRADAARAEAERLRSTLRARFEAVGIRALDPDAMRDWLRRSAACLAELAVAREAEVAIRSNEDRARQATDALGRAMGQGSSDSGVELVSRARALIERRAREAREREHLALVRGDAAARARHCDAELEVRETREREASRECENAVVGLGLDPAIGEEELTQRVADARRAREARALLERVDAELLHGAAVEARLGEQVAEVARAIGAEPPESDSVLAAERLVARLNRAQVVLESGREARRMLDGIRERAEDAHGLAARAAATMAAHLERAGVTEVTELPRAEASSARARAIDARLGELETALRAAGDGVTLDALEEEVGRLDSDGVAARLDELSDRSADAERRRDAALQHGVERRAGLAKLDVSRAADHAVAAEEAKARALGLVLRYARLKVAGAVLDREMESYRRAHQGPVLARAQELFVRLAGSFDALRVVVDDRERPALVCVRGTEEVHAEGLSDGTRDQLYLALRLATIERHASAAEPLMLVLDDALVHFDDERSRIALGLLGEVARTTQVLFFTHHARAVDLAREALGDRAHLTTL